MSCRGLRPWLLTSAGLLAIFSHAASAGPERLSCPSRGLRARFGREGYLLEPGNGAWRWGLRLSAWGRPGGMEAAGIPCPVRKGNRIELPRPRLLEWYESRPEGIEQGFEVAERPEGEGPLVLEQALGGGLSVLQSRDDGVVFGRSGSPLVAYRDLKAFDASGRPLPTRMTVTGRTLSLEVEDAGAAYPVFIDPLSTTPAVVWETDLAGSEMISVRPVGDVNGDGYTDVAAGAYAYSNGQASEGRTFVFHGGPGGLATTAAWAAESNQAVTYFGFSLDGGDVNRDGYSDLLVGNPYYANGQAQEGRAWLYHGGPGGLSTTAIWVAESDQVTARYGYHVACAGDVNGDGYSDMIVGAYLYDNGQTDEGRAWLYHGSAAGLSTTAAWVAEAQQGSTDYGQSVDRAGDVNGDGFSDVIVSSKIYSNGETNEGRVWAYHGSAAGLSTTAAWTVEGNQGTSYFGIESSSAGDLNRDGFSDVIVGAYFYDNGQTDEGRVYAYHGSAAGLSTTAAWTVESDQSSGWLGRAVHSAGDVNGDGFSDLIVSAYFYDNGETDEGRAYAYLGSAAGLSTTAAWMVEGNQASALFGASVAGGDVNGDGFSDMMVAAQWYANGQAKEGRVYVYHGDGNRPQPVPGPGIARGNEFTLLWERGGCFLSSARRR